MIVGTARDAAQRLGPLFDGAAAEMLAVLHLDRDQRMIAVVQFAAGAPDTTALPLREIAGTAIALGSAGLIIAHNHMSGDPQPSRADIDATRCLADAAAALGIGLHDHLVFGAGECRSFRDLGLL